MNRYWGVASVALAVLIAGCFSGPPGSDGCLQHEDCADGYICSEGQCLFACEVDRDCLRPTQVCENGLCHEHPDPECGSPADCRNASPPICHAIEGADCLGGECHYPRFEEGEPCGEGRVCTLDGTCGCRDDADCLEDTQRCEVSSGRCVQCLDDADCNDDEDCEDRHCVERPRPDLCGNGVLDPGEDCDSDELVSCESLGLGQGLVRCTEECLLDTGACGFPAVVDLVTYSGVPSGACVLLADGTLRCWGKNSSGQANAPFGFDQTVSLTNPSSNHRSGYTGCAVAANGSVYCVDTGVSLAPGTFSSFDGRCGVRTDSSIYCPRTTLSPPTGRGYTDLRRYGEAYCALDGQGAIVCWGDSAPAIPAVLAGQTGLRDLDLVQATSRQTLLCVIADDGLLSCWEGDEPVTFSLPSVEAGRVLLNTAANQYGGCMLGVGGEVACFGEIAWLVDRAPPGDGYLDLQVTYSSAAALRPDGRFEVWGDGPANRVISTEVQVSDGTTVDVVIDALSRTLTCGIGQGMPVCWRVVSELPPGGGLDDRQLVLRLADSGIPAGVEFVEIAHGNISVCARSAENRVYCWGATSYHQLGSFAVRPPLRSVASGMVGYCGLRADSDELYCWGNTSLKPPADLGAVRELVGDKGLCALLEDGSIRCWGSALLDDLEIPAESGFEQVDVAQGTVCALRAGEVECWVRSDLGAYDHAPAETTECTQIAVSHELVCCLDALGAASCWRQGVLLPTPPGRFTTIDVDWHFACALLETGMPDCWEYSWELTRSPTPWDTGNVRGLAVSPKDRFCWINADDTGTCDTGGSFGADLTQIAPGVFHSCALDSAGRIECVNTDLSFDAERTYVQVVSGIGLSCALDDANTVHCSIEEEDGSTIDSPNECMVKLDAGGFQHVCGLTCDGDIVCWAAFDYEPLAAFAGEDFVDMAVYPGMVCGMYADGRIACQDGAGASLETPSESFSAIDIGHNTACGETLAGELMCWDYRMTFANKAHALAPALGDLEEFSVGVDIACALHGGRLSCWGARSWPALYEGTDSP